MIFPVPLAFATCSFPDKRGFFACCFPCSFTATDVMVLTETVVRKRLYSSQSEAQKGVIFLFSLLTGNRRSPGGDAA